MRVLVLGGTGDMGRRAALDLSRSSDVATLTVTSRSLAKAEALAQSLGKKAQAAAIDANDRDALVRLMRSHDVVAGAVGPYYLYEVPLAQAAIDAGIPYTSLCDDYDAAAAVIELDATAKDAGVTILTGAGWTPGITNMLVRQAAEQLDQADEAHISWAASASDSDGHAVLFHMLHILTGNVPTYINGRQSTVPAGSGRIPVDFGNGLGTVTVYHVGHPEPVTLPRFVPNLQTVTLRGGLREEYLNLLGRLIGRLGLTRTHAQRTRLVGLLARTTGLLKRVGAMPNPISGLHIEVRGRKAGRRVSITFRATGHMADLTALPLSVTALMMGRGEISQPGVFAPEGLHSLDPQTFFDELAQRGITIHGGEIRPTD